MPGNPFATNETAAELWFEQTNNAAVYIGAIAYGLHILIFSLCVYYMVNGRKWRKWLPFIAVLFMMATVNICMNIHFNEMAWIDDRDYPGGPLAFLLEHQSSPINTAGNAAAFIATFVADGMLLFRVYALWRRWYLLVIPMLMWLATAVLSVFTTLQAARPDSSLWANNTLDFSVPYWSLSIALNILLTLLLISRLLYMRHVIFKSTLLSHFEDVYAGYGTVILESALPYCIVSVVFIILYGLGNTAANLFIPLLLQIACIAPEVIILRIIRGLALSIETYSQAKLLGATVDRSARLSATTVGHIDDTGAVLSRSISKPEMQYLSVSSDVKDASV